jgi:hypothetical protein
MKMKSGLRIVAVVMALALLAACNRKPQPPLVFGASTWPGYEPVYLARELGYFKDTNLRLVDYDSPAEVEQAFRNRSIQLAAITLDKALLLRRDIPELKIILLFDTAAGEPATSGKTTEPWKRMDVLVTRDDSIGQYHPEMHQLLQGWRRALDDLQGEPVKALQMMAKHEHLSSAQFGRALQGVELYGWQRNQQLMIGEPPPIGGAINAVQRAMLNRGALNIGVDPSMLLEPALLAEPEK